MKTNLLQKAAETLLEAGWAKQTETGGIVRSDVQWIDTIEGWWDFLLSQHDRTSQDEAALDALDACRKAGLTDEIVRLESK